jgi:hypothetical protein
MTDLLQANCRSKPFIKGVNLPLFGSVLSQTLPIVSINTAFYMSLYNR